jgi:hypothetical protein
MAHQHPAIDLNTGDFRFASNLWDGHLVQRREVLLINRRGVTAYRDPDECCPTAWLGPRRLYDAAEEGARAGTTL